jgi:hypothetical protein
MAAKFIALAKTAGESRQISENQLGELIWALNGFSRLRLELVERQERLGGANALEWAVLLPGEREIIDSMNGGGDDGRHVGYLTWQRRSLETGEEDLIPGVKYILGHDPSESNRKWSPALEIEGRIAYIDSFRSSGYNGGLTAAHYFAAEESLCGGQTFLGMQTPVFSELDLVNSSEMERRAQESFQL